MSNNISADTLFHFMRKFEYLEAALRGKFSPRYYKEIIPPFFNKKPIYIAMKCFCDIPLSLVGNHVNDYGEYAIGFSKKWGIENNLNPLTYYNEESYFIESIKKAYNANIDNVNKYAQSLFKDMQNEEYRYSMREKDLENMGKNMRSMQHAFLNFKPYQGRMWNSNKKEWKDKDVMFYNEREWRYFIRESNIEISQYYYADQKSEEKIFLLNKHLERYRRIEYEYEDINFIIVKNFDEIIKMCDLIDSLKIGKKHANILKTKILRLADIEKNV